MKLNRFFGYTLISSLVLSPVNSYSQEGGGGGKLGSARIPQNCELYITGYKEYGQNWEPKNRIFRVSTADFTVLEYWNVNNNEGNMGTPPVVNGLAAHAGQPLLGIFPFMPSIQHIHLKNNGQATREPLNPNGTKIFATDSGAFFDSENALATIGNNLTNINVQDLKDSGGGANNEGLNIINKSLQTNILDVVVVPNNGDPSAAQTVYGSGNAGANNTIFQEILIGQNGSNVVGQFAPKMPGLANYPGGGGFNIIGLTEAGEIYLLNPAIFPMTPQLLGKINLGQYRGFDMASTPCEQAAPPVCGLFAIEHKNAQWPFMTWIHQLSPSGFSLNKWHLNWVDDSYKGMIRLDGLAMDQNKIIGDARGGHGDIELFDNGTGKVDLLSGDGNDSGELHNGDLFVSENAYDEPPTIIKIQAGNGSSAIYYPLPGDSSNLNIKGFYDIAAQNNGDLYVIGERVGPTNSSTLFLVKPNGTLQTIGPTLNGTNGIRLTGIEITPDGAFALGSFGILYKINLANGSLTTVSDQFPNPNVGSWADLAYRACQ
jgi:hypothetical protein